VVKPSLVLSRRGGGTLGCLVWILLAAGLIFLAVQFGKPWFRYQQFHDVMKSSARYAVTLPDSVIRARLVAVADSLDLPSEAKRVTIRRSSAPAKIVISSEYSEKVVLPLINPVVLRFKARAEEAL
jgi:hypothetical protein